MRGPARKQAKWAARILGLELLTCGLLGVTTSCTWLPVAILHSLQLAVAPGGREGTKFAWVFLRFPAIARRCAWVVNSLGLAFLSGILWQDSPPRDDEEPILTGACTRGLTSMSQLLSASEQEVYHDVVKQLASRGFRLGSLLSFWEQLLEEDRLMPDFDPTRSLTNDVVRGAIIPESRRGDEGFALASLWSAGAGIRPQVMVSHNWTNSFRNLVAAILADALEAQVYGEVAAEITTEEGIEQVRSQLSGKLERTYWVCAFSVNQHASICAGFGPEPPRKTDEWKSWNMKRLDSVTGKVFPLCSCKVEKVFSNSNGRCELNKFDDMMAYLAGEVAGFWQLVVVDDDFDVFYRAWCVAELFQASVLRMKSKVQVSSQQSVDLNYDKLSLLDVRQCMASAQEDKDMIISKIYDVDAFNLRLQELVFSTEEGLFAEWIDGRERSRQVGTILRRCALSFDSTGGGHRLSSRGCLPRWHRAVSDSDGSSQEWSESDDG